MIIKFKSLSGCYGSGVDFRNILKHHYGAAYEVINEKEFFLLVIKYGIEFKELNCSM